MPLRFWVNRKDHERLRYKVHELERLRRRQLRKGEEMAGGLLLARIEALELSQQDTQDAFSELATDVTKLERQVNKHIPFDRDSMAESSGVVPRPASTATSKSSQSRSDKGGSSHTSVSEIKPSELPTTFTRRSGNGIDRIALETIGLRLSQLDRPAKILEVRSSCPEVVEVGERVTCTRVSTKPPRVQLRSWNSSQQVEYVD